MTRASEIAERLKEQRARLAEAARAASRDPDAITLIAVSKKHDVDSILAAYAEGQRDFGENYVQELVQKAERLAAYPDIRWHLIGHLQSNKARFVARLVRSVHTVSSAKLATELGKRVRQHRRTEAQSPEAARARGMALIETLPPMSIDPIGVLIEVNVSGEASKSGCSPDQVEEVAQAIDAEPGLVLRGLMAMPPHDPDPEAARPHFERLRALRDEHGGAARLPDLSMGMSQDMHVAVAAGATLVRVGSAIFGSRPAE